MKLYIRTAMESSHSIGEAINQIYIEAYTWREPVILVDFNIELIGLIFDISTLTLREAMVAGLKVKNDTFYLGEYGIDEERIDFYVLSTEIPLEQVQVEMLDVSLPDWAWVVIFGGAISVCLITMFGCTVGCNRWRKNRLMKNQYLSAKTLAEFKSFHSLDALSLDGVGDQSTEALWKKNPKGDNMWTLQKREESQQNVYSKLTLPNHYTLPNQKVKDWQSTTTEWRSRQNVKKAESISSSGDSDSGISSQKRLRRNGFSGKKLTINTTTVTSERVDAPANVYSVNPSRTEPDAAYILDDNNYRGAGATATVKRTRAQIINHIEHEHQSDSSGSVNI